MKYFALCLTLIFSGLFLSPPLLAHHGEVNYDTEKVVSVKGTVTDFHFVNPHCVVEFDVKDENGKIHKWQGEFSNPSQLSRQGWTAASLEAGDKFTITGNPAKNNAPAIHVARIRMPNGQEVKVDGGR